MKWQLNLDCAPHIVKQLQQLKGKKFAECEKSKLERLPENAAHGLEMRTAQPYLKESITDNIY